MSLLPGTYRTSDQTTPAGNTIASVFGSYFQDNNPAVTVGVAIVSVTGVGNGIWQFLPSSGGTWANFPTVSTASALLLSANDMIRFVPKNNFAGTVSLTALAWDGSVGADGKPNILVKLARSAFSTTTLTATASANHAPTLAHAAIIVPSVVQYATSAAVTVASLLTTAQAGFADLDGKSLPQGIAIVGTSSITGTYQYMLPHGTWQSLSSVSESAALLLPSNALLRFIAGSQTGPATLTFDAWDQTQGLVGKAFDITRPAA